MVTLFEYNWQVRDEWFSWCKQLSIEDLMKKRVGGVGSIFHTFIHIIDVEFSWIRAITGAADIEIDGNDFNNLTEVISFSDEYRMEIKQFLHTWSDQMENEKVKASWVNETYTKGEILRHIIAHEIHHIGQLSIWAREIGLKPISPNFIGRNLITVHKNQIK